MFDINTVFRLQVNTEGKIVLITSTNQPVVIPTDRSLSLHRVMRLVNNPNTPQDLLLGGLDRDDIIAKLQALMPNTDIPALLTEMGLSTTTHASAEAKERTATVIMSTPIQIIDTGEVKDE